jgi:parallel beta-helix repeat protein
VVGDAGYAETIIDAQQTNNVFEFTKEEDSGDTITLDGFTITGGLNFRGGGITVLWADPTISNSYITANMSTDINGGGIYLQRSNATIFNCIIENNTALQQKGGGISSGNESAPLITNSTIVNNGAGCDTDEGGGGISVGHNSSATIKNTILWGNYRNCAPDTELNQILAQEGSVLDITYSCIQGGGFAGDGNTDQDPVFRGPGDYHLMLGSSCIESANSEGAPETDIDGNARYDACFIPDTGVGPFTYYDMGAIEYQGDSDGDGILDDADESCTQGDNPCSGGVTESCDDNCIFIPNTDQDDAGDGDGIGNVCDNCPVHPNGTLLGTCAKDINPNLVFILGTPCADMNECGENEFCLMNQEDTNGNDIGDVCECESDFDCDQNVDSDDLVVFLDDFGRNQFNNPCVIEDPCLGDLDCDRDVDADDVAKFLEDFGRSTFNNPCPTCGSQTGCEYE